MVININKSILFLLIFFTNTLVAQVKVNLHAGLSSAFDRIEDNTNYVKSSQFLSLPNFGVSLEKQIKRKIVGLMFSSSTVGLKAKYFNIKYNVVAGHSYVATNLYNFEVFFQYTIFNNYVYRINPRSTIGITPEIKHNYRVAPRFLGFMKINLIGGVALTKVQKNVNWKAGVINASTNTSIQTDTTKKIVVLNQKWSHQNIHAADDAIVQNRYGMCAKTGISFCFFRKQKEIFALNILYNQGFVQLLKSTYSIELEKKDGTISNEKGIVSTRGSSLNFMLSFPITLIKHE